VGKLNLNEASYVLGWREWICLPDLNIFGLKAKVDTGARTSVLHAFRVAVFEQDGIEMVDFSIHPDQRSTTNTLECRARLYDKRWVTDSGGHKQLRPCIKTNVKLGPFTWPIELTLTNRDEMLFRFLLGRSAIPEKFLVSVSSSYLIGKGP
jgi:hypothetical protein